MGEYVELPDYPSHHLPQCLLEPRLHPPLAIVVSITEQRHIEDLRARSYQLAVERGHILRG